MDFQKSWDDKKKIWIRGRKDSSHLSSGTILGHIGKGKQAQNEPNMTDSLMKRPRQQTIKCWGCEGDHMCKDFPRKGDKINIVHNLHEVDIVEYMGWSMPRIYVALDNRQVDYQSHMIEMEGKIDNQTIAILIGSGASHIHIDHNVVDIFKLKRCKHEKYWLVQLATRTKRRINELAKNCVVNMNGVRTKTNLNIIPLGSYDFLIGMDWIEKHHDVLYCYNKAFTCIDEEGNSRTVQGIPRPIYVNEIYALQLIISFRKGCQTYAAHMEDPTKD
jgi:hypothetical protein